MENTKNNKGLIIAISFATLVVAGSAVFLGLSLRQSRNAIAQDLGINGNDDEYETYLVYARKMQEQITELTAEDYEAVSDSEIIRGEKNAPITIIEYTDFECPYCKFFHPNANTVVENSAGKVNWVFRHFPLSFHDPEATEAALATECVHNLSDGKLAFDFADLIFERGPKLDHEALKTAATELGVDGDKFSTCLTDQTYASVIEADKKQAPRSFINGTPGLILINNKTGEALRIAAALDVEQLESLISQIEGEKVNPDTTEVTE